jgi:CRP-like cAMP-binding protein
MMEALRAHIEKIVSLTDEEFEFVCSHFSSKRFSKHQYIVQDGQFVNYAYFLNEGLVKTFYLDERGKEHILDFAMDGDWITDNQSLYQHKKAEINIYCLKNCETFYISCENIGKLCASLDKMQGYFRKKAVEENIRLQRRILCLLKNNATDRYHDLIKNYPELVRKVPKTLIASYVGVSRETLSRMLVKEV